MAKPLAALPRVAGNDISWLAQWADAMNRVNQLLIFTGGQVGGGPALIERNMVDYEDVMFPAWAFMAQLQTRMLLSADLFMDAMKPEDRHPGARQGGLVKIIAMAISSSSKAASPPSQAGVKTAERPSS